MKEGIAMIDYLFISPLGWSNSIWEKIIKHLDKKASIEIITFLDSPLLEIDAKKIRKKITKNIHKLSDNGIIIAASFGVVSLLSALERIIPSVKTIILIDGFEAIPNKDELLKMNLYDIPEKFHTIEEYLGFILEKDDTKDSELVNILTNNLNHINNEYVVKLSNNNMLNYLLAFSNYPTLDTLKNFLDLNKTIRVEVFSSRHLPLKCNIHHIETQEHLLMLSNPQKIIDIIKLNHIN